MAFPEGTAVRCGPPEKCEGSRAVGGEIPPRHEERPLKLSGVKLVRPIFPGAADQVTRAV
jgi:hypothetical protein